MNGSEQTLSGDPVATLTRRGTEWSDQDLFQVKTWFAQTCTRRAFPAALLRLSSDARMARAEFANQAVLEWFEDRFDRMAANYDPSLGDFVALAITDLGNYVTSTFSRKLRRQWSRELPETEEDDDSGKTRSVFARTGGEDPGKRLERIDLLREVVTRLSEADRSLLAMVADGISRDEIAGRLGISTGNARIAIFRARGRAREILAELEPEAAR